MNYLNRTHRICQLTLLLATLNCAIAATIAQEKSIGGLPPEVTPPAQVGLSEEGLKQLTALAEQQVATGKIAGAVMLIARHGRIAFAQSVGFADRAKQLPMQRDSMFRIASMTKVVTSVAVMQLVEEGLLNLDDPLSKFIPQLDSFRLLESDESTRSPTIHELLTHTSGLTYGWFGPADLDQIYQEKRINDLFTPVDETMAARIDRLSGVPLVCPPGAEWNYGFSTDVLGRVIEIASGLPLDVYFQERIFRPLQMRDTVFYVPPDKLKRLATLYTIDDQASLLEVTQEPVTRGFLKFSSDYCIAGSGKFFSGGGGLVSTADDYMRLLLMLQAGGQLDGARILQSASVASMTTNQIGDMQISLGGHGDGFGYGFGILTQRGAADDVASVGTYSWGGIFNTLFWVDPQQELVGVLMTQLFPFDHLSFREDFKRLTYAAIDDSGFRKVYWYQPGTEFGNPVFNNREIRVSSPNASTHPTYSVRKEPKSSGTGRILIEEDLRAVKRADVYCEMWGGHPGTANKRLSINGRHTYDFPDVGCRDEQCTHQYTRFNVPIDDLVNGYNSLQFACDQGSTFWGHYIVDNCAIEIGLPRDDARLDFIHAADFEVSVAAKSSSDGERLELQLQGNPSALENISHVSYHGYHDGYDENGVHGSCDWHGMTKGRQAYGHLGTVDASPFRLLWDTSMLPAQSSVAVRARVHFREDESLVYLTPVLGNLQIAAREGIRVEKFEANDLPKPFWSRADRLKSCTIELPLEPSQVEKCQLLVVAWSGGAGSVEEYFTLNGLPLPIADDSAHQVHYRVLDIPVESLRQGSNKIELRSDTEHHGIEILAPGPALMVRYRL